MSFKYVESRSAVVRKSRRTFSSPIVFGVILPENENDINQAESWTSLRTSSSSE